MPRLRKEGDPTDTECFYAIQDFFAIEEDEDFPLELENESLVRRIRKVTYYNTLQKYLKAVAFSNNANNDLKQESSKYNLQESILYNSELNILVITITEDLVFMIKLIHKDLGHYKKRTTLDTVKQRYK